MTFHPTEEVHADHVTQIGAPQEIAREIEAGHTTAMPVDSHLGCHKDTKGLHLVNTHDHMGGTRSGLAVEAGQAVGPERTVRRLLAGDRQLTQAGLVEDQKATGQEQRQQTQVSALKALLRELPDAPQSSPGKKRSKI